jgi:hypothetical protein
MSHSPMNIARRIGNKVSFLGWYVQVQCSKCGKWNGNWTHGTIVYGDCDCTLSKGKGRHRTIATLVAK